MKVPVRHALTLFLCCDCKLTFDSILRFYQSLLKGIHAINCQHLLKCLSERSDIYFCTEWSRNSGILVRERCSMPDSWCCTSGNTEDTCEKDLGCSGTRNAERSHHFSDGISPFPVRFGRFVELYLRLKTAPSPVRTVE